MTDYFLKFPDEQTATEALECRFDLIIDVVGKLYTRPVYTQTGVEMVETYPNAYIDEDGNTVLGEPVMVEQPVMELTTPPQLIDGWHVNIRAPELPEDLVQYSVIPANPQRVFA